MHQTAYENAQKFYSKYCKHLISESIVVDFGSYDVNGTLRPIFQTHRYIGIDMCAGPNVDIVCDNKNVTLENNYADIIVSSSCFEHDEMFWLSFLEMCRVVKQGGLIYINVPSRAPYHAYPVDCWRFYIDSWKALEKWANYSKYNITLLESYIDKRDIGMDSVGIFIKN